MSDTKLNYFVASGTNAERVAFTPVPPTPAAGPDPGYFFYETDTGNTYAWDGSAWDQVNATAAAASTTEQLTGTDNTKRTTADSVAALWEQGPDVASAGTTSLGEGGYFNITGTTTITDIDFATDKAGRKAWVKFAGILTLTHNASTLILPTGANITTAAGDTACFVSEGTDVVRCVAYQRASGAALAGGSASGRVLITETVTSGSAANVSFTSIPATYRDLEIRVRGRGTTVAAQVGIRMRYNADIGANYDFTEHDLVNATTTGTPTVAATFCLVGVIAAASATANYADLAISFVGDYRGTAFQKAGHWSSATRTGTTVATLTLSQGGNWWRSTAAITQVDVFPSAGAFVDGSIVSLYGLL